MVLGLPRGGVPVAAEVARVLHAPLDIIVVRKLGVPFQPELAMGAIGEGDVRVLNAEVLRMISIRESDLAEVERRERIELDRRARRFRGDRPAIPLSGRTAIIVDDGIATGSTARSACLVARAHGAARVILAMPVGPVGIAAKMRPDADEVICLHTPQDFSGIGQFYPRFLPDHRRRGHPDSQSCLGDAWDGPARGSALRVVREPLPVDDDTGLVPEDPRVMPRRDDGEVTRPEIHLLAVVHHHMHPSRDEVAQVRSLAAVRLCDRLHVLGPLPARLDVARPTGPASRFTSSSLPLPSPNGLVSSGESKLIRIILAMVVHPLMVDEPAGRNPSGSSRRAIAPRCGPCVKTHERFVILM